MSNYKDYRLLHVKWNNLTRDKRDKLVKLHKEFRETFKDMKLRIKFEKVTNLIDIPIWIMKLYGFDGYEKYKTNRVSKLELQRIFHLINQMPMRRQELRN